LDLAWFPVREAVRPIIVTTSIATGGMCCD
jgi:hypothetical protein